eukprot:248253-Rhodomonas_salina.2
MHHTLWQYGTSHSTRVGGSLGSRATREPGSSIRHISTAHRVAAYALSTVQHIAAYALSVPYIA